MAEISSYFDSHDQTLTILVSGPAQAGDFVTTIRHHYQQSGCQLVIWDLCDADLRLIDTADLEQIMLAARQCSPHRPSAPTLFIGNHPFIYGMLRMYTQQARTTRIGAPIEAFRNWDQLNQWLENEELPTRSRPSSLLDSCR
ncbi:hypothetical protein [Motiliproteus sp.]|uniref:hypothetical protein n=1 Tax=Motiliproteus sp. TaxID=1898955 RepID=UPI003BACA2CB